MKIIKLSLFIALTICSVQCSSDFLETAPPDTINTANYPQTAEDLITLVNGAYQPLQRPKLYNMRMWTTDIIAGNSIVGAGGGDDGIETLQLSNFTAGTDNAGVLDLWRGPWPGILSANIVLKEGEKLNISESIKKRSLGEAHFLRSYYYFLLVRFFGGVPLITEPQSVNDDLYPARASKEEVYELIISDLENAISMLPEKQAYSSLDIGRVSKGTAIGMLAKVYLTLENWSKVVELTQQLEGMGYSLNTNYGDNFSLKTENSNESLFEVQYHTNGGYDFWSNEFQSSWGSTFMGPRGSGMVAGAYGWNQPTEEFINQYEVGDNRKDITVLYEGCPTFDGKAYNPTYSFTGHNVRKFLVGLSDVSTYDNNPLNFPILRYADILLMKAEAHAMLGQVPQALVPLNSVRERAGLSKIINVNSSSIREIILKERRLELAFEGDRWFDLLRVDQGQYGLNFLHSIGKTNASTKHLLFPVPQIEIDRNPKLTQNPGY